MLNEVTIKRKTKETDVKLTLYQEGGSCNIKTGIGFFDHMLELFSFHSGFNIDLVCKGDLFVDSHHTVEDVGIVLGDAFNQMMEDKSDISRYGSFYIPMDEALSRCVVDFSGRPYLVFNCDLGSGEINGFEIETVEEFFRAFAFNAKCTLHMEVLYGSNKHHMIESLFKAAAHAIKDAAKKSNKLMSTKGIL